MQLFYNFNKVMNEQTKRKGRHYFCRSCFHTSISAYNLEKHTTNCERLNKKNQRMNIKTGQFSLDYIAKTVPITEVFIFDLEVMFGKKQFEGKRIGTRIDGRQ